MAQSQLLTLTLLIAAGGLLGYAAPARPQDDQKPQEGKQEETVLERDIYGRPLKRSAIANAESFKGAWELLQIVDAELPSESRTLKGTLIVADGFMAWEIHCSWDRVRGFHPDFFQSGIFEYFLAPAGRLYTRTVLASYLDEAEELDWEMVGELVDYSVVVSQDFLTISLDDGARLEFARRHPTMRGASSTFFGGRGGQAGAKDIYGRPIKSSKDKKPARGEGGDR